MSCESFHIRVCLTQMVLLTILAVTGCAGGGGGANDVTAEFIVSAIEGPTTINEGDSAEYSVTATGGKGVTYAWAVEPASVGTFTNQTAPITTFHSRQVEEDRQVVISVVVSSSIQSPVIKNLTLVINDVPDDEPEDEPDDDPDDEPENQPPVALAEASTTNVMQYEIVEFTDISTDPDGADDIVKWEWDFSYDAAEGLNPESGVRNPVVPWDDFGTFYVQMRVIDQGGLSDTLDAPIEIVVNQQFYDPVAWATSDTTETFAGVPVHFMDDGSYDPDGGEIVKYEWDFDGDWVYDAEGADIYHSYDEQGNYEVHFRVTDDEGAMAIPGSSYYIHMTIHGEYLLDIQDVTPQWLNAAPWDIAIHGSHAYVPSGYFGMDVLDITDASNPVRIRRIAFDNSVLNIAISGNYAYVSCIDYNLYILDISIPGSEYIHNTLELPYYFVDIEIANGYAYLVIKDDVYIVDIDPPESASIVKSMVFPADIRSLSLEGDYLYPAANARLYIVDISTPEDPVILNSVSTGSTTNRDLVVEDGYAYIASESSFRVVDVDPPEDAQLIHEIEDLQLVNGVALDGGHAFVPNEGAGLTVIDIHEPESASIVHSIESIKSFDDIAVAGGYAYMTESTFGMYVADISDPQSAFHVGSVPTLVLHPNDVFLCPPYLYVACGVNGICVLDVSTPENATIIKHFNFPGEAHRVGVKDGYLYVTEGETGLIRIFDIDPLDSVTQVKTVQAPDEANDIEFVGDHALVGGGAEGILSMEINPPEAAYIVDSQGAGGTSMEIAIGGDYAYHANGSTYFHRVNISDLNHLEHGGSVHFSKGASRDVVVSGDNAYVAFGEFGLMIIDIAGPTGMKALKWVHLSTYYETIAVGVTPGYALCCVENKEVQIVDVDPIDTATVVDTLEVGEFGRGYDIHIYGEYAYISWTYGLKIFRLY